MRYFSIFSLAVLLSVAGLSAAQTAPAATPVATTTPTPPPTLEAGTLFTGTGLADAVAKFKEKIGGPLKVMDITVYKNRVIINAQDPKKPENVDQYTYANGVVEEPVPVQLSGGGNLEDNLFNVDDVNLAATETLARTALDKITVEGAQLSHMAIKLNLPFSKSVMWRSFVNGTRKNGFVDANAKGEVTKVQLN